MELTAWLSLVSICILGAITPGPSLAVILKHTINGGRANGLCASITHGLAIAVYALLTVLGMAIIITNTPWLFNLIKYAGAAFLLFLAFKALTAQAQNTTQEQRLIPVTLWQSGREGFLIAFLNPKIALFFLALFSQFIDLNAGWQQKLIMVGTVSAIDTFWYCLIAVVLSRSGLLTSLRQNSHIIDKITGIALLAVTIRVLI